MQPGSLGCSSSAMRLSWQYAALGLGVLLLLSMLMAAGLGFMPVSWGDILRIVAGRLVGTPIDGLDPAAIAVVFDVRLPRILAAVCIGGMLSLSGGVLQGILLNPLADSYTLGISTGAAFGASLALVLRLLGLAVPELLSIPLFAFIGAMGTLMLVLVLAGGDRRLSSTNLILAGVIVAAILSAAIGFLKFVADEQVGVIIFWLMGSLAGVSWTDLAVLVPVACAGLAITYACSRDLNAMATGERLAASLGVSVVRLRLLLLAVTSLMTALAVSVAGIIGFVGLVVPHMLRFLTGPDNRHLLPLSFLGGAWLLLAADTLTRAVLPAEVPIGVLTALLGGPFFCAIFMRRRGRGGF
jgi:iron complex transport system permease protein